MFEELYKTSYSHGLEDIYALETIDIKTVRPLAGVNTALDVQEAPAPYHEEQIQQQQPELDLGPFWRGSAPSFILLEPIQVLNLHQPVEKTLRGHGIHLLQDLLHATKESLLGIRGLGQGHIDEVLFRFKSYTERRVLHNAVCVDFCALLRAIVGFFEKKKIVLLLQELGLEEEYSLTPLEAAELKRLTKDKRLEWKKQALEHLQVEVKQQQFANCLDHIVRVFVLPWIHMRGGIAAQTEVEERLIAVSFEPLKTEKILKFFSNIYYHDLFPLSTILCEADEGVFCLNSDTYDAYRKVNELAESYYYQKGLSYPLEYLCNCILRELGKSWINYTQEFVRKAILFSPRFRLAKTPDGVLSVRLS